MTSQRHLMTVENSRHFHFVFHINIMCYVSQNYFIISNIKYDRQNCHHIFICLLFIIWMVFAIKTVKFRNGILLFYISLFFVWFLIIINVQLAISNAKSEVYRKSLDTSISFYKPSMSLEIIVLCFIYQLCWQL